MFIVPEYRLIRQWVFLPDGMEYPCPTCRKGMLKFRDRCSRSIRHLGGEREWLKIPRHQCDNEGCGRIHRMLPDILLPYKHYEQPVVRDSVDGRLDLDKAGNAPSAESVKRWCHWLMASRLDIEGYVKSAAHRELEFGEELLRSSVSVLEFLRMRAPMRWLSTVIRIIYNTGGFLRPFYG